jgi:methyl-accepting chemotaxis protein PixJ
LRELVRQVKVSAAKVGETSEGSTAAVDALAQQAQRQSQELAESLLQLQQMVESIQTVADDAGRVEQAVQEANRTVQAGDSIIELTVTSIQEIRETVSEAGKKIKRLGESSQKIAKVVSLIENFATQTNLLALNAAIEATRAGEYGRGFAVVADEVRSLAHQSASATTEIERLVQEIQFETKEVAESMEAGIMQVVQGTSLVNETRQSLNAIAAATSRISELVQGIAHTTTAQTKKSQVLTNAMTKVADIASQTSADSVQITRSFQDLLATSHNLQASVSRFIVD